MLPWILLAIATLFAFLATFVAYRFYRKAAIYDEILTFMYDDVETNIMQFGKLAKSNVMMSDPQIQLAHKNMMIMGQRLEEILRRMESATGLRLRPAPPPPRPKVI